METDVSKLILLAFTGALLWSVAAASEVDKVSQVFIRDAIQGNFAKIQLGQLAQEKAQSTEVKSYGQMLVKDHSAANDQAEKVAEEVGVTAPTEPSVTQKAVYDRLSRLSGATFDREFAREMVADDKINILRFQNEAKKKNDPVADFANRMLPTLQKHLDSAQKLSQSLTFE